MNKFKLMWLFMIALVLGACSTHNPTLDDVTPPQVDTRYFMIVGFVTDMQGNPFNRAVVQNDDATYFARTDAEGYYEITVPGPGNYKLTGSAPEATPERRSVSHIVEVPDVPHGIIVRQDFRLPIENKVIFEAQAAIITETLIPNPIASVKCTAMINPEHLQGGEKFEFSLEYFDALIEGNGKDDDAKMLKYRMLFAPIVRQVEGVENPDITYTLAYSLNSMSQENVDIRAFKDGEWTTMTASHASEDSIWFNNVRLDVYYGVWCLIDEEPEQYDGVRELTLTPTQVDNLYGSAPVFVESTKFDYNVGVEIILDQAMPRNQLSGLLLERMVYDYGLLHTIKDHVVEVNTELPVGTGIIFSGRQRYYNPLKYIKIPGVAWAEGIVWGPTEWEAVTYNRQHTGGGGY